MLLLAAAILLARPEITTVPATDKSLRLIGRFDKRDAKGPKCSWTASAIEMRFVGKDVTAVIQEKGTDFIQVELDGQPTQVLRLTEGEARYPIRVDHEGEHLLRLVKRTEPFVGTTQFVSFQVEGTLKPTKAPKSRIEVIGDSITCAYGNEAANERVRFSPDTENGYLGYGPVAARVLGSDCSVVAWSGRKMWPDNTVPEIYDLAVPTDPTSTWTAKEVQPLAVLINLATNDFGVNNPEEAGWTKAYETFLAKIRVKYPKARIYCAIGPMMSDNWPAGHNALTTLRGYLTRMVTRVNDAGDKNVALIEFPMQDAQKDGLGADWHPSVKKLDSMGKQLAAQIRKDLRL